MQIVEGPRIKTVQNTLPDSFKLGQRGLVAGERGLLVLEPQLVQLITKQAQQRGDGVDFGEGRIGCAIGDESDDPLTHIVGHQVSAL